MYNRNCSTYTDVLFPSGRIIGNMKIKHMTYCGVTVYLTLSCWLLSSRPRSLNLNLGKWGGSTLNWLKTISEAITCHLKYEIYKSVWSWWVNKLYYITLHTHWSKCALKSCLYIRKWRRLLIAWSNHIASRKRLFLRAYSSGSFSFSEVLVLLTEHVLFFPKWLNVYWNWLKLSSDSPHSETMFRKICKAFLNLVRARIPRIWAWSLTILCISALKIK